ncbi:MAG: hypothetical protein CVU64_20130 [Deltaproteobacteria bacterium HGW-Deltaproteobacteria-21]|jgi:hypothetical protein|nr:MAG: hypothetical protein CVU64_20130 [Deltaproteobacteria bacterium HGW-Deltaproteobacteria-21]
MVVIQIEPGVCGFRTMIQANRIGDRRVRIEVESDCARISELGEKLRDLGMREVLKIPMHQNPVYEAAGSCRLHPSCPVPCGIIKAAEAALDLALEKDVKIQFRKDAQE